VLQTPRTPFHAKDSFSLLVPAYSRLLSVTCNLRRSFRQQSRCRCSADWPTERPNTTHRRLQYKVS
jgi:hypothetical protein